MPIFHDYAHALRIVEAAGLGVWLFGGGVMVGWLRWGMR